MKFNSYLLTKEHVKAMVQAMRTAGLNLEINWKEGTVIASHKKAGEVFRALEKGKGQPWIVRHVENLFA